MAILSLSVVVFPQNTATTDGDKTIRATGLGSAASDASTVEETSKTGILKTPEPKDTSTASKTKTIEPEFSLFEKSPISQFQSAAKQADANSSGWKFGFAPYLYLTGLKGTVGARGRTAEIDLSVGDVLSDFKFGFMGVVEARKGRFVIVNDLIWIKLTRTVDTPGALFSSVKVGVNQFMLNPQAGYRIHESKKGSVDILGGVRIESIENNVNFRTGILPGFDVSQRKTWATPVFGARALGNLSPRVFVNGKFDIGGGFGADVTGQLYAGAGFRINPNIAIVGGWRYMVTDYNDGSGFVYNTRMNGLVTGMLFNF